MKEEDWEAIVAFCDQINKDLEGPQTSVRLMIHKIQSPQEKESLLALTVSGTFSFFSHVLTPAVDFQSTKILQLS